MNEYLCNNYETCSHTICKSIISSYESMSEKESFWTAMKQQAEYALEDLEANYSWDETHEFIEKL